MKKIFFLTALLCASMMGFAVDQDTWIPVNADGAAYANQFKWYEIDGVATPNSVVEVQKPGFASEVGIYVTFADAVFNAVYYNGELKTDGTDYKQDGAGICFYVSALTKQNTEILIKNGETTRFGLRIYNDKGSTGAKSDPELTINKTAVTLDAGTSETFEIEATKADGAGAISYESNKPGIASVDESGVVTAVGRGTAIITVSVAENDDFEGDSKKLTVTVTGPINWDALSWVENGSGDPQNTGKYKVAPAENQNVINIQQPGWATAAGIYTEFPATISSCDLGDGNYKIQGAGIILYLSAFSYQVTKVTVTAAAVDYEFYVYYAGGTTTAIDNTVVGEKAIKVIENGQLIIIKNGVRYNAIGTQL